MTLGNLTRRQSEIASMILMDEADEDICERLGISPNMLRDHLYAIRSRIGAESPADLRPKLRALKVAEAERAIAAARRTPRLWCHV
ncbi:MAG: hypothetical protein KA761_00015 [Gemmatimonadaceae bacterium]|nr:hypothetical protein [Gemmatimonadaceae bacterium]